MQARRPWPAPAPHFHRLRVGRARPMLMVMGTAKLERKYLGHQIVLFVLIVAPLVFLGNAAYQSIYGVPEEFLAREVWWTTDSEIRPVLPIQAEGLQPATATLQLPCSSAQGRKFDVEIVVDENGEYVDGRVMGVSDPDVVRCILRSLEHGKFEPARYHGRPVPAIVMMRWDLQVRWCGR